MRFVRLAVGAALAASLVSPRSAIAGIACTYDEGTHTVHAGSPNGDRTLTIIRNGDAIEVEESNCGEATVNNTDTIVIDATTGEFQVNIHLAHGMFRPGFSEEPGDNDEIEFELDFDDDDSLMFVGSDDPLQLRIGGGDTDNPETLVNLNAGEASEGSDADVVVDRLTDLSVSGNSAEGEGHAFDARGGLGTGQAWPRSLYLFGGSGDDRIVGGVGRDHVRAGLGDDFVNGSGGRDRLKGSNGDDFVIGGKGIDKVRGYEGDDRLRGELGADFVVGGTGNDVMAGGRGADWMRGLGGTDDISGGDGNDELYGDGKSDLLDGGRGTDFCDGGEANDDYRECELEP